MYTYVRNNTAHIYMTRSWPLLAVAFASAAFAAPIPFQITGIAGGFIIGCSGTGCGGKFQAEMGGVADGSGSLTGGTSVFAYCIDSQNAVDIPSGIYQANVSQIVAGADLSKTRYGRLASQWDDPSDPTAPITFRNTVFSTSSSDSFAPNVLQRYQMAAWLVNDYALVPASSRAAVQDAIWQVFDVIPLSSEAAQGNYTPPPYPDSSTTQGAVVQSAVASAASFVKSSSSDAFFSQFAVVTNAGPLFLEGQDPAQ